MSKKKVFRYAILTLLISYLIPVLMITTIYSLKSSEIPSEYTVTVDVGGIGKVDLSLEEYVVGVVASEMPASFEFEALKVQAVLARTYVVQYLERGNTFITDTITHQVYSTNDELKQKWGLNYSYYFQKVRDAV